MKLTLKTLTPLHVGNGEELYALDYICHNQMYYRVSQNHFLEFIKNDEKLIDQYTQWIDRVAGELDDFQDKVKQARDRQQKRDYNQQLSYLKKKFNLLEFAKTHKIDRQLLTYLEKQAKVPQVKLQVAPKQQIRGHIKTGNEQLYIPGSSIKGAVRSALLYQVLQQMPDNRPLLRLIQNNVARAERNRKDQKKLQKHFADQLEQLAFYCQGQYLHQAEIKTKSDDEKFDLLKLLLVADGRLEQQNWGVGNVNLYLVAKVKDRRTNKFDLKANEQPQAPSVEMISENQLIHTQVDFNIDFLYSLAQSSAFKTTDTSSWIELRTSGKILKLWIGIREKVQQVFGIDMKQLTIENKETIRQEVLHNIFDYVQQFSKAQLQADVQWLEHFAQYDDTRNQGSYTQKIQAGKRSLNHTGTMLRLGFGAGFNSTTEVLHLLQDATLKDAFRQMMKVFLIGDAPGAQRRRKPGQKYEPNPDRFPKSRRMLTQKHRISPLGWLALYPEGTPVDLSPTPTVEAEVSKKVSENEGVTAAYFTGQLNPKKRPEMNAIVVKSGTPNEVEVWVNEAYKPIVRLDGYRSAIDKGKVIIVNVSVNKKKKVGQVSFVKFKS